MIHKSNTYTAVMNSHPQKWAAREMMPAATTQVDSLNIPFCIGVAGGFV